MDQADAAHRSGGEASHRRALPILVPAHPLFERYQLRVDYADAFAVAVPAGTAVGRALAEFCRTPWWMNTAMWLRDQLLARPLGLARGYAEFRSRLARGELFAVVAECEGARLMGEVDSHLEFQLLAEIVPGAEADRLVMTTRVRFINRAGRLYFLPVRYGHRWLVPRLMGRVARRLWAQDGR
jgi:hypothetical protein